MSKLYIGNLPTDVSEATLRQIFQDHNLQCGSILVKRGGYAFIDCLDPHTADTAIETLNALVAAERCMYGCTDLGDLSGRVGGDGRGALARNSRHTVAAEIWLLLLLCR
ncbi:hypothetical protein B566_EDAN017655 [Ephemera danica]|nr:hypothetical protein B566_EDAN017655 [Ephemera danica]